MKTIAALATATMFILPGIANATYMCDRLFAKTHKISCPAGSVLDGHTGTCVIVSG